MAEGTGEELRIFDLRMSIDECLCLQLIKVYECIQGFIFSCFFLRSFLLLQGNGPAIAKVCECFFE